MKNIAIYSRKSIYTGKGESIKNQIQLCKDHCKTYIDEKDLVFKVYEDEGFSGKNTNRPKFKELLKDIKSNKIDILICYRLDRISRNVSDFSSTLELLQKYNVTFISLKEQFDTSTPMGRAMIYIASVFAQLERETIADRVKDNMLQLAKMGKWSGGQLPIGFSSEKVHYFTENLKEKTFSKLVPIEDELDIIKFIYKDYLLKGSILEVVKNLNEHKYKSKNGADFELSVVKRILKNPIYVKSDISIHEYLKSKGLNVFGTPNGNGYLTYNKNNNPKENWIISVSSHKGIIDSHTWLQVQKQFDKIKSLSSNRTSTGSNTALFSGLLKCKYCKRELVIKYNKKNKEGKSYIYYVCPKKLKSQCSCPSLRTDIIDKKIMESIVFYNEDIFTQVFKRIISNTTHKTKIDLTKKEKQLHNLIIQLSNTEDINISKMILKEIRNLNNEILKIKHELSKSKINSVNVDYIKNQIKDFKTSINNIKDINIKRQLIRTIIKEIIFDFKNKSFDINFK